MGIVYFVRAEKSGLVKIGFAKNNAKRRVQVLQTGCPEPLSLVHFIEGLNKEDETKLHRLFESEKESGEWFQWEPRVSRWIEKFSEKHTTGETRAGFRAWGIPC
jgi:hypothetical protein